MAALAWWWTVSSPPVAAAAAGIAAALDSVADVALYGLGAETAGELIAGVVALQSRLAGLCSRLLAHATVGTADRAGAAGLAGWLRATCRTERVTGHRQVRLATALHGEFTHTLQALVEGRVSEEQARVIVRAVQALPTGVDAPTRREAEAQPLARPRPSDDDGPDPRTRAERQADALTELCRRALAHGGPDGAGLPDLCGETTTIVVTIRETDLREAVGAALLPGGDAVSAATARRLACDARILPALWAGSRCRWTSAGRAGCSPPPSAAHSSSARRRVRLPGGIPRS